MKPFTQIAIISIGLISAAIPATSAQTFVFGEASFATGNGPRSMAAGDFNGDGRLDLAVSNNSDNTVSILLGKPDGTFQPHVDFATDSGPGPIAAVDFNNDGKLDLVVVNLTSGTTSILLGNGDGTFEASRNSVIGANPLSLATGDFNGDGRIDVAVLLPMESQVVILLGNGDGTFHPPLSFPTGSSPLVLTSGDFNGDGHLDLAVATYASGVSILLGMGDGTFQNQVGFGSTEQPSEVIVRDFNGDGRLDLAVANFDDPSHSGSLGGFLSIFLGNGDGTFQAVMTADQGPAFVGLVAGDFNGDGILDLVGGGEIYLGKGDGSFLHTGTCGVCQRGVAGDINGDGKLDLAGPATGGVLVLLGNGDGTFGAGKAEYAIGRNCAALTLDLNHDGQLDLVVANCLDNTVTSLLGNGGGTFNPQAQFATGANPVWLGDGDFNGDGKPDLAVANFTDNTISILLGNGDGTFRVGTDTAVGGGPFWLAAGDLDKDGKLDLVVANFDNTVYILLGNGDGSFRRGAVYPWSGPLNVKGDFSVTLGDFNGDGMLDLAMVDGFDNLISIFLGNGDGTFSARGSYATGAGGGSLTVGDFNGDGKLDLAHAGTYTVSTLLGNGDGTFQTHRDFPSGGPLAPTSADFNGDGKLDLALTSINGDRSSILLGNGDGSLKAPLPIGPLGASSMAAGDFNGDGTLDLAVGNSISNSLSVFLSSPVAAFFPSPVDFGAQPLGTTRTQTLAVSNPGSAPLKISGFVVSGGFTQTNTCNSNLSPGAGCAVEVSFAASALGQATGSLRVSDNAPGGPQIIPLTGAGADFALSASPTSATINPGQSATFNFVVNALGVKVFPQAVPLTCNGAPQGATCSVTPGSVTPEQQSPPNVTVIVTTTARSILGPRGRLYPPSLSPLGFSPWIAWLLASLLILTLAARRPQARSGLAATVLLVVLWTACGGPGNGGGQIGTPAGTYTLTVTATTEGLTHISSLTLIVK